MFTSRGNSTYWCSKHWTSPTNHNKDISSSNTSRVWIMEWTTSTFNRSSFDTLTFVPTTKVECTIGGHHTTPIQHVDEVTFTCQRWQFITTSYYIPRTTIPSQSSIIVGYYFLNQLCFELNYNIFRVKAQPTHDYNS
jgi:hypothetical protein